MQWAKHKQSGFTIVELLIVVIVIAILATITIVGFNGIQNRAKNSALQSAASQATRKVELVATEASGMYPADKAAFLQSTGLADSSGTTYSYLTSDDRRSYCTSVTDATNVSSSRTNSFAGPLEGRCVQNLVLNPSSESNTANTGFSSGHGGVATATVSTNTPFSGSVHVRRAWTTAPSNSTTTGLWATAFSATGLNAGGKTYAASGYIRNSWANGVFRLNLVGRNTAGAVTGETYGPDITISNNTWTRLSTTWTAPANTDYFEVRLRHASGALPTNGTTTDVDAFMLTETGTLTSYGGPETSGWVKRDSAVNSVSFGPAVEQ